ncbi:membrane protein insertase YidC [Streptomyces sp. ICBB 8177]|uniref:YidC/Oxa1 family membrane protein insertase n=1 Tax=Streptomyces sp. ICBB 8177 TaxID=563922 RepID=UPI001F546FF7|nr:membrane protein insertase YidC [Streptomyces sp. ICBB 8177]
MFAFTPLVTVLSYLAGGLSPLLGTSVTAAAIVLFTVCVRLALHPLARAAARGECVRARLAPDVARLNARHRGDPERMRGALTELYAREGVSPIAGCLPMLVQLPFFFVMNRLFWTGGGGLLDHAMLLGAPLEGRWTGALRDGGPFGAHGLVFLALFAVVAVVATWTYRRTRAATAAAGRSGAAGEVGAIGGVGATGAVAPVGGGAVARMTPWLSFASLLTVAVVPLGAGLYTVTTVTWTAVERAWLTRRRAVAPGAVASTG